MSRSSVLVMALLLLGSQQPSIGDELNVYDWLAIAPLVAIGESLGQDGKYTEVRLDQLIRGTGYEGQVVRVRVQRANRDRDLNLDRKALRLDVGLSYVILLEPAPTEKGDPPTFDLVRGVRGARELPAEGAEPLIDAVRRFVEIQDLKDDRLVWSRFAALLGETHPLLIETALDEFIRFRRGDPDLMPSIQPLLDHPSPLLRERASVLIGQIVAHGWDSPIPDVERLQTDLVALARRDGAVAVRIAAAEALTAFDSPAVVEVLEAIARDDPDQTVRYTAEKWLYRRSGHGTRSPLAGTSN